MARVSSRPQPPPGSPPSTSISHERLESNKENLKRDDKVRPSPPPSQLATTTPAYAACESEQGGGGRRARRWESPPPLGLQLDGCAGVLRSHQVGYRRNVGLIRVEAWTWRRGTPADGRTDGRGRCLHPHAAASPPGSVRF